MTRSPDRSSAESCDAIKRQASKILFGDPAWLDRADMAEQMDDEFVEDNGSRSRRITPNQLIAELNARTGDPAQSAQVSQLQKIHDAVNALGGRSDQDNSYDQGIVDTIGKVLAIIEQHIAAQPPAAPVEKEEAEFNPSEWEAVLERREDALHGSSAGNGDAICYIERSKVREILIGHDDDYREILETVLSEVDELPITTTADIRGEPQTASASMIVGVGCKDVCDFSGSVEVLQPTTGNHGRLPVCKTCGIISATPALSRPEHSRGEV